jgi:hypothetical protein
MKNEYLCREKVCTYYISNGWCHDLRRKYGPGGRTVPNRPSDSQDLSAMRYKTENSKYEMLSLKVRIWKNKKIDFVILRLHPEIAFSLFVISWTNQVPSRALK